MGQEFPRATAAEMAGQTISLHTGQSADGLGLVIAAQGAAAVGDPHSAGGRMAIGSFPRATWCAP